MKSKQIILVQGRWTKTEQDLFNTAISISNKTWAEVSEFVGTRTPNQCRSHYQKFRIGCKTKELPIKNPSKPKFSIKIPEIKEADIQCCETSFTYPPILNQESTDTSTNTTPVTLPSTSPFTTLCNSFQLEVELMDFPSEAIDFLKF